MGRVYHTAHKRAKFYNIIRNLITELIIYGHIKTTKRKKEEILTLFDQVVNWAKKGTLHDYRQILKIVRKQVKDEKKQYVLEKLKALALRYPDQNSGYLKIYKLGRRRGDNAPFYYLTTK